MSATDWRHIYQFPIDQLDAVAFVEQTGPGHSMEFIDRPAVVRHGSTLPKFQHLAHRHSTLELNRQ
jgi:hypothetical protein